MNVWCTFQILFCTFIPESLSRLPFSSPPPFLPPAPPPSKSSEAVSRCSKVLINIVHTFVLISNTMKKGQFGSVNFSCCCIITCSDAWCFLQVYQHFWSEFLGILMLILITDKNLAKLNLSEPLSEQFLFFPVKIMLPEKVTSRILLRETVVLIQQIFRDY